MFRRRQVFNNYIIHIKHERECFIRFPNTEKRVENTTRSGVFLTSFEVLFWAILAEILYHCRRSYWSFKVTIIVIINNRMFDVRQLNQLLLLSSHCIFLSFALTMKM